MPNQNPQNQTFVSTDQDIPPTTTVAPPPAPTPPTDGTAAPVADITSTTVVTSNPSERSMHVGGKSKIVAAILGILVLVGGAGAGIYLTQQNQNPQSKAGCLTGEDCSIFRPGNVSSDTSNKERQPAMNTPQASTPSPSPITSLPPVVPGAPKCIEIRAYNLSWTRLTATALSELAAGEQIYISVRAESADSTTNGGLDQAKFSVNGVERAAVTTIKTKAAGDPANIYEFYDKYTIPASTTSFNITATVHHTSGWY